MSNTLLLDTETWDWLVDSNGNIAVAEPPYAYAQDAASAIKLFQGELYYDTTQGIPYWSEILGKMPPTSLLKSWFVIQALSVPGILKAKAFISSWKGRLVKGQVQVYDKDSRLSVANF